MNVASLELSKELYAVSGWIKTSHWYDNFINGKWHVDTAAWPVLEHERDNIIPAYDLGYLLRKLPPELSDEDNRVYLSMNISVGNSWCARYADAAGNRMNIEKVYGSTPEDAAAKLAIELIKQNIITPNQRERE